VEATAILQLTGSGEREKRKKRKREKRLVTVSMDRREGAAWQYEEGLLSA